MTESIVNGIFLLGATVIGSVITLIVTQYQSNVSDLKDQHKKTQNRLVKTLLQIESYHLLEDLYASKIATETESSVKTVKIEFRDQVVQNHQCERPLMTANEAKKQINRIS